MAKEIMRRTATDNEYLHKDFHAALNCGIQYLHCVYGETAVREYLRQFARLYYADLIRDVRKRGLIAFKEHFEKVYRLEGTDVLISISENELTIQIPACPAVTHMRKNGITAAELFYETTKTVNDSLCEDTPFAAELKMYDKETGAGIQRFYRKKTL